MISFSQKNVAILGLGIEGQDICRFLIKNPRPDGRGFRFLGIKKKAKITVFDQKTASELGKIVKTLKGRGVKFKLGKKYLKNGLEGFDIIFRSPAFKTSLPAITKAKKKGSKTSSATELFFKTCPAKIIGVTGTKGKGTTSTLIYKILKRAGKRVFLAGNIGQPMLTLLPKLDRKSWVVLELSSFQLQDLNFSPHIAVVLFITSEHLDYHHDTKEYIRAKSNIVRHQNKNDLAILNADNPTSSSFARLTPAKILYFSRQKKVNGATTINGKIILDNKIIGPVKNLKLRGEHNRDNINAAITTANSIGINKKIIKKEIFSFKGLEHRLELVTTIRKISFYNDSFSTTPETAIAAIRAFREPIILIAGGSEKGSNYNQLGKEISKSTVKTLILIGLTAKHIRKAVKLAKFKGEIIYRPGRMEKIVKIAFQKAKPNSVILLSPACASFDMFKNYKDRGDQFKKNVKKINEEKTL
ncbi:UDP-N-acetylmuramoyl-L-alanine--D-glutamate ligase [Candidatus Shapirobacteria bacterium CG09_land_8_20_14_0_10_38_17]|uniref:UDP-N-acetylmuramoylalanine--D-glutamate ligase n=1 Tax=Candidatus Shapirobacteria bacterium CG09_land_8_20_14_0_10_38_17 TaxID=1974884 RepID=A0A2H0WR91_9BACT|nr:MAG: UDP-N-acetylmuramoyl-L-alanine--D-glutamate ligase [Candidatus Shapirobacteria bacterium CG09_land_8_20_14_0_10_38_17]